MGEILCNLFTLFLSVYTVFGVELCKKPADIAFVIDGSRSLNEDEFETQIKFVQELVKTFDVGRTTQVAALTFSEDVAKEFYFKDVASKEDAYARIGKIKFAKGGATYTHKALEVMRTDLFSPSNGARDGVAKICILLTDGESTARWRTEEKAQQAKDTGITIVAIGIGDKVDADELRAVVSAPVDRNFFLSSTFDDLKDKVFSELIGEDICGEITTLPAPTTTPGDQPDEACQGKSADIVLIVDMSTSIYGKHFEQQLQFLAGVVSFFDINSGKTRVGMMTFSNSTKVQFYLNDYNNMDDVIKAITATKQELGLTNTHLALERLRLEMLSMKHGSRRGVAHIAIVVTDGISRQRQRTEAEANLIHKAGVDVFAIGVGYDIDVKELNYIASRPDYAYEVKDYDALKKIKNILGVKACEVTAPPGPKPTPSGDEPCKGKMEDVIFVVDMSSSIWTVYVEQQLQFLADLVNVFDVNSGNARFGMVRFSTEASVEFYLNTYGTKEEIMKKILSLKSTGGNTNTHLALQKAQDMMTWKHGYRPNVEHVVIVITDGVSREPILTVKQASEIHRAGVEVIAIGVGDEVDKGELEAIASRSEFVFGVHDYTKLQDITNILAKETCKVGENYRRLG